MFRLPEARLNAWLRTPRLTGACVIATLGSFGGVETAASQARPLPVHEELRIGGEVANLTTVHWLGVSRNGIIVAAQRMDGNVRVYDAAGRPMDVLGRPGGGPREFGSIGVSGWMGDSLWVHDPSAGRITFVRPNATLGESRPTPAVPTAALPKELAGMALGGTAPSALYSDGSTLFKLPAPQPPSADGNIGLREAYWQIDAKGGARQIFVGSIGEKCTVLFEGGAIFKPFCRQTLLRESPDGMHLAAVDQMSDSMVEVAMMRRDGGQIWKRRLALGPKVMTRSAWDSIIGSRTKLPMAPAARDAWLSLKAPPRFPPVRTVLVGRDGSLWIEGWGTNVRPWTVLRPDGSTLGTITLPGRAKLAVADLKQIWSIELDEDDLPSIVRYRIGK